MTDLAGSMGKLLAMWMDRDPQSRRSSIETYLAPDVEFRSPFGQARGYDELEKYSDFLQEKYPGTGFFVDGPVPLIGDYVRLPFLLKEHDGSAYAVACAIACIWFVKPYLHTIRRQSEVHFVASPLSGTR